MSLSKSSKKAWKTAPALRGSWYRLSMSLVIFVNLKTSERGLLRIAVTERKSSQEEASRRKRFSACSLTPEGGVFVKISGSGTSVIVASVTLLTICSNILRLQKTIQSAPVWLHPAGVSTQPRSVSAKFRPFRVFLSTLMSFKNRTCPL